MSREVAHIPAEMEGIFVERPNRFLGRVQLEGEGKAVPVHIHDPGRLREILFPGNRVLLHRASGIRRKTAWDLVAGQCNGHWVLVHSSHHRAIAETILSHPEDNPLGGILNLKAEVTYQNSRLDFVAETYRGRVWIETKGCTLCREGIALFPDAPTTRGKRHLEHLRELRLQGERAAVIILVFRPDSTCFAPNHETDPAFAKAFWAAVEAGVEVYPLLMEYHPPTIFYRGEIPLREEA